MSLLTAARSYLTRQVGGGELGGALTSRSGGGIGGVVMRGTSAAPRRSTAQLLRLWAESAPVRLAGLIIGNHYAAASWSLLRPATARRTRSALLRSRVAAAPAGERRDALVAKLVDDGDLVEVEDHPFLRMVAAGCEVAPWLSLPGYEVEWLSYLTRRMVGEDLRILIRGVGGVPVMWVPIPPHWMQAPTAERPTFRMTLNGRQVDLPPEDVAWQRTPTLDDPYDRGAGTGHALDHEIAIDEYAAAHLVDFLRNRARPDLLIMGPGLTPGPQTEAMEERWMSGLGGRGKAGLPYFLGTPAGIDKAEITIHDLQKTAADMPLAELRREEFDTILMVFGVPPDVVGRTESSNRSTAYMAKKNLRDNTIVPDLEARRRFLQHRFFGRVGGRAAEYLGEERLIVHYTLPPLIDQEVRAELIKALPYAFSQNQVLAVAGMEGVEGGDRRWFVPAGITVRDLEAEDAGAPPPPKPEAKAATAQLEAIAEALMGGEPAAALVERLALPPASAEALTRAAERLGFGAGE